MNDLRMPGDQMEEACGVFGIYDPTRKLHVADSAYYALYALQHRGQESAGIAVADGQNVRHYRGKGLAAEVFDEDILATLTGHIAIGHVRYSTFGGSDPINAQPLVARYKGGTLALAHNGNLTNTGSLRARLEDVGAIFQTNVDTEVILNLLARMCRGAGMEEAVPRMMRAVRGSYALVLMSEGRLVGIRDPYGIRPLCLGRLGQGYALASESCAFDAIGAEFVRDVYPGEVLIIDEDGLHSLRVPTPLESRLCVFEFVYFARTDSVIDGVGVYAARKAAGQRLAMGDQVRADMVIGVPDSALPAAIGYAEQSGIPYGEGLAKNRYVGRTFIQPEQGMRENSVRTKLNALTRNVHGKRIVMVDDSIVRGTTSRKIVDMLRLAGAREVHMRISSPTVMYPCHLGIDTPSTDELIGSGRNVEEICTYIGADSLRFLSQCDLLRTVEGSGCGFCTGCFNGKYPMDIADTDEGLDLDL
ncbi:MAG: amidophosphoribosyltransferase [Oscillospiraceae bacterium]|jgi:amidophosphoribosyltransferase|nr:amidophosphoribosyltransferase [Oscillospiraceae bacterium]